MHISKINNTGTKRQKFGNAECATQILRFLNTSPAIGATFVDVASMSAPRTIIDFSRSKDAGTETGIREFSCTSNHVLIGAYGMLAAALFSLGINNKYNVKANKVFANFDNIDALGNIWHNAVKANKDALKSVAGNAHNAEGVVQRIPVDNKSIRHVVSEISAYIDKNPEKYTLPKKVHNKIKSILTYATNAESDFLIQTSKNSAVSDIDGLIKNTFALGKVFSEPKVLSEFRRSSDIFANNFIKSLKSSKLKSSLVGVAMSVAIGSMIQPFNVWLTKKRTGKEGFVGVEGGAQDKSTKFKIIKGASAAAFTTFAYSTIVDNIFKTPIKTQFGQLLNRLQFNGLVPSIPQLKTVYAFTIASRLIAARDKNELRESATKDFLGFVNWLILGDFTQKIVASLSGKNLTMYDEKKYGKGFFSRVFNQKVKTHDEILFEELKKLGIDYKTLCSVDGKMLSPKDLIKKFADKLPDLKSRLKSKNIAQLSGYLYSAAVLGIFIPKLNIYITKKLNKTEGNKNISYMNLWPLLKTDNTSRNENHANLNIIKN